MKLNKIFFHIFSAYFDVVKESLRTYGQNCVDSVVDANHEISLLLKHPLGLRTIHKLFK